MIETAAVVIATARLRLRQFVAGDLDNLAEIYADPLLPFNNGPCTRDETATRLQRLISLYAEQGFGMLAVEENGRLIGRAGFLLQSVENRREVELAYLLSRASWGRGYATEAACALRDHALAKITERLVSLILPENTPSIRVAERAGLCYERDVEFRGALVRLYSIQT